MGLDMYLKRECYVSPFDFENRDQADSFNVSVTINYKSGKTGTKTFNASGKPEFGITVELPIAYWRKANAVHRWFIENCGRGDPNCTRMYVPYEKIIELVETCKQIRADHSKAPTLLPTQEGFFFGSTEYDEWYFNDIDLTISQLENLTDTGMLYYEASW